MVEPNVYVWRLLWPNVWTTHGCLNISVTLGCRILHYMFDKVVELFPSQWLHQFRFNPIFILCCWRLQTIVLSFVSKMTFVSTKIMGSTLLHQIRFRLTSNFMFVPILTFFLFKRNGSRESCLPKVCLFLSWAELGGAQGGRCPCPHPRHKHTPSVSPAPCCPGEWLLSPLSFMPLRCAFIHNVIWTHKHSDTPVSPIPWTHVVQSRSGLKSSTR